MIAAFPFPVAVDGASRLRWLTQRDVVNFHIFDVELDPEDMGRIASLDKKASSFFDHRDPEMVKALGKVRIES